jgi:hypothetical protein
MLKSLHGKKSKRVRRIRAGGDDEFLATAFWRRMLSDSFIRLPCNGYFFLLTVEKIVATRKIWVI